MNVRDLLNEQFKDLITEETLSIIEKAFNEAVEAKTNEKISLAVKAARQQLSEQIDKDHTRKLKRFAKAIDVDHSIKLQRVVEALDKKHTAMLQYIIGCYNEKLQQQANKLKTQLSENISKYLELYLDKTIPQEQINEAVKNIHASKVLENIRQMVGISKDYVDAEIKQALRDGKNTIDSLRSELDSVLKENVELKAKIKQTEAKTILNEKTQNMSEAKRKFVYHMFKNKSPEYIIENFNYVSDLFDKEHEDNEDNLRVELQERLHQGIGVRVDRPKIEENYPQFTDEIVANGTNKNSIQDYLTEMRKIEANPFAR